MYAQPSGSSITQLLTLLAIDDFGTGYSSLAYLKHFPLNVLKIDKSFIDDLPYSKDDKEITATIIAMGHILGFQVLAEGVENLEQLAFLQEKGCDTYQGFFKSVPLPATDFVNLLEAQQAQVKPWCILLKNPKRDGIFTPSQRFDYDIVLKILPEFKRLERVE